MEPSNLTTINEEDISKFVAINANMPVVPGDFIIDPSIFTENVMATNLVDWDLPNNITDPQQQQKNQDSMDSMNQLVESLMSEPASESKIKCENGIQMHMDLPSSSCEQNGRPSIKRSRKRKYEEAPFSDEEDEKKRQNATKAYENRKKNKELAEKREEEIKTLREENNSLSSENKTLKKENELLRELKANWENERNVYQKILLQLVGRNDGDMTHLFIDSDQ